MKIAMKFDGGTALDKALGNLTKRMGTRVMRGALLSGAEVIRRRAAQNAPYAPGPPDLRDNIGKNYVRRTDEQAAVAVGPVRGFAYGLPQELGTRKHAAQPFMRPAFDTEGQNALGAIRQDLQRELLGSARNVAQGSTEVFIENNDGPLVIGGPGGGLL